MEATKLKGLVSKEEFLSSVADFDRAEPIDVECGNRMEFVPGNEEGKIALRHQYGVSQLSMEATGILAAKVGLPRPYLRKIPKSEFSSLVLPHLNYWYRNQLAGNVIRLLNIDDRTLTVVPRADFEHIKISDIVALAEKQLGDLVAGYHKFYVSNFDTFYFSIVTTREIQAVKGDPLNAGIRIRHSISGQSSTMIQAYVFRQWCTNGATAEDHIDCWFRRRGNNDFGNWVQKSILEANKAFDREVDRLARLAEKPVGDNISKVVDGILTRSKIPKGLQKEVRNTFMNEDYFDKHPLARGLLDRVASHLSYHSKLCPVCHKIMEN